MCVTKLFQAGVYHPVWQRNLQCAFELKRLFIRGFSGSVGAPAGKFLATEFAKFLNVFPEQCHQPFLELTLRIGAFYGAAGALNQLSYQFDGCYRNAAGFKQFHS